MNSDNTISNDKVIVSKQGAKLTLPATEVFYQRAMKRSAEINTRIEAEIASNARNVCDPK